MRRHISTPNTYHLTFTSSIPALEKRTLRKVIQVSRSRYRKKEIVIPLRLGGTAFSGISKLGIYLAITLGDPGSSKENASTAGMTSLFLIIHY